MGYKSKKLLHWTAHNVHPNELKHIFERVYHKEEQLKVDVDLLNIYIPILKSKNNDHDEAMKIFAKKIHNLASFGFHVTCITDGISRPDCKRASWRRVKERIFSNLNSHYSRQMALSISQSMNDKELDKYEKTKMRKEIKSLNNASENLYEEIIDFPTDFIANLETYLFSTKPNIPSSDHGFVEENIIQAEYQADSLISYRVKNGISHIPFGNDNDYHILLGPEYIVMKGVDKAKSKEQDHNLLCTISGCSPFLQDDIQELCPRPGITWDDIDAPILNYKDPVIRALVAVILGNDVSFGVKGLGSTNILEILDDVTVDEEGNKNVDEFIRKVVENSRDESITPGILRALVAAVLYEPACEAGSASYSYMYPIPPGEALPKFLQYYKKDNDETINIVDGPTVRECAGLMGHTEPHTYLEYEGTYVCDECSTSFCRTCGFVKNLLTVGNRNKAYHKDKNECLCSVCYRTSSIDKDENMKTVAEMRDELERITGNKLPKQGTLPHEIEDMYHGYINRNVPMAEEKLKNLKYPVYKPSFFDELKKDIFFDGPIFGLKGFLCNKKISDDDAVQIIKLISNLLRFEPEGTSIYSKAVPKMLIDFANNSRLRSGDYAHKMLKSCIRTATDERLKSILRTNVQLFRHKSSVGMVLQNTIPPSMKQKQYDTKVAFTSNTLLCTDCTCDCSGTSNKKTRDRGATCGHNLPLPMQLSLDLDRGYVTHFLADIAAKWDNSMEDKYKKKKTTYSDIKSDLIHLMRHCKGLPDTALALIEKKEKIFDMLDSFKSRTRLPKIEVHDPPNSYDLMLFRDMPVISNKKVAERERGIKIEGQHTNKKQKVASKQENKKDEKININSTSRTQNDVKEESKSMLENLSQSKAAVTFSESFMSEVVHFDYSSDDEESVEDDESVQSVTRYAKVSATTSSIDDDESVESLTGETTVSATTSIIDDVEFIEDHESVARDSKVSATKTSLFPESNTTRNLNVSQSTSIEDPILIPAFDINSVDQTDLDVLWTFVHNPNIPSKEVVKLKGDTIYDRTFTTLDDDVRKPAGDKWVNDEIINGYTNLLKRYDESANPTSRSHFLNSAFMEKLIDTNGYNYNSVRKFVKKKKIPGKNLFDLECIYVPINIGRTHWALITVEPKGEEPKISYRDNYGWDGKKYLNAMMMFLSDLSIKQYKRKLDIRRWTLETVTGTSRQENNFDCGVCVCIMMYLKLNRLPMNFTQADVYGCKSRRIIAWNLMEASKTIEKRRSSNRNIELLCPIVLRKNGNVNHDGTYVTQATRVETFSNPPLARRRKVAKREIKPEVVDLVTEMVTSLDNDQIAKTSKPVLVDLVANMITDDLETRSINDSSEPEILIKHVQEMLSDLKKNKNKVDDILKSKKSSEKKNNNENKDAVADERDEHNLPKFKKENVDYITLHILLDIIFDGDIPTDYIGFRLICMRAKLQMKQKNLSENNLQTFLRKERQKLINLWKRLAIKTAEERHNTSNIKTINASPSTKPDGGSDNKDDEDGKVVESMFDPKEIGERKLTNEYKAKTSRKCNFAGCQSNAKTPGISFYRVPPLPCDDSERKQPRDFINYKGKKLLHREALKRMGIPDVKSDDLRICSCHPLESVKMNKIFYRENKDPIVADYSLCVPIPTGVKRLKSECITDRGIGLDRASYRVTQDILNDGKEDVHILVMKKAVQSDSSPATAKGKSLNKRVREALNLKTDKQGTGKKLKMSVKAIRKKRRSDRNQILRTLDITDKEVKKTTGFKTKAMLLGFTVIACNGDIYDLVTTKTNHLTWFEEWYLFYENLWMRSASRTVDYAEKYNISTSTRDIIINNKLDKILTVRNSWDTYCSHEEDVSMRSDKWDEIVSKNERIIQHDTTSLRCSFKPSRSKSQRLTWNSYYRGNVAKGSVSLQLCGWIVTDHLWVGSTSDDQYMIKTRIFERLQEYAENDEVKEKYLPFINIMDRGYRMSTHAFRCGKQEVRQPVFKKEGRRFTGFEVLKSASVASIRSGNERAVRKAKLCGWLRKGLMPRECPKRFDNVWLCWGFMINFMYRSNA